LVFAIEAATISAAVLRRAILRAGAGQKAGSRCQVSGFTPDTQHLTPHTRPMIVLADCELPKKTRDELAELLAERVSLHALKR
jgi:hypothetical protein